MTMPNMFLIGAAKSGTTSLFRYLEQHPDIYMCTSKEPNFFCNPEFLHGDEATAEQLLAQYRKLFSGATRQRIIGEASGYLHCGQETACMMQEYVPNAKLIAILRHPVERAFSHYTFSRQHNLEKAENFVDVIRNPTTERHRYYRDIGFYAANLNNFFALWPSHRILVCLYEDLNWHPVLILNRIFDFLGLCSLPTLDISKQHNRTELPRSRLLKRLLSDKWQPARTFVKKAIPAQHHAWLRESLKGKLTYYPKINSGDRRTLIELYRKDILALEQLIGRDLSSWLRL